MRAEQGCNLGLDGLHQQRSRTVAQNLSQRVSKTSWLAELKTLVSVTAYHSFGGEVEARNTPHDTPPYPFMPSPTFAHSSFEPVRLLSRPTDCRANNIKAEWPANLLSGPPWNGDRVIASAAYFAIGVLPLFERGP
jgi:hypothetical protein